MGSLAIPALDRTVGRERAEQRLEPVHAVPALRQDAAVHGVRDRAESVELKLEGPCGPVEGFAPRGRDDRGDGHTVTDSEPQPPRQSAWPWYLPRVTPRMASDAPPDLAHFRSHRLERMLVYCSARDCWHQGMITLDELARVGRRSSWRSQCQHVGPASVSTWLEMEEPTNVPIISIPPVCPPDVSV